MDILKLKKVTSMEKVFPFTEPTGEGMEDVLTGLKGETVSCQGTAVTGDPGWTLVCAGGFPLGWAKRTGDTLKNKYNPGWRWQ